MLRKLLLAPIGAIALTGSTLAADLAAPPPPAPEFSFAGFYLGARIGYAWGEDSGNVSLGSLPFGATTSPGVVVSSSTQTQGVVGGFHIGNLWQINHFVFGLEGQVDGTSLSKTTQPLAGLGSAYPGLTYIAKTESPIQGLFLARIGYAFDRTLFYVTGGGGYAWIYNRYQLFSASSNPYSTTNAGWTLGGGLEYAIDKNWSLRAEYRYIKFSGINDGPIIFNQLWQNHNWVENRVQVGFSYRWPPATPPAVVAKY